MFVLSRLLAKLAGIVFTILVIAIINFAVIHSAPGDPASVIAGQSGAADAKFIAQIRADYGLDQPFFNQLVTYVGKVLQFDLGYSYRQRAAVSQLIAERLGPTLLLTLSAFFLSLIGGVLFGAIAGKRNGSWGDLAILLVSLLLYATPVFWLGLMLVLVFSIQLEWLPAFGYADIRASSFTMGQYMFDVARHAILPVVTLAAIYMAVYIRLMRSSLIEVSHEDHVRTARAKGLNEAQVLSGHMLRNAAVPVVTFAGLQAGALIGGSVVVETVFSWPGLGRLTYDAVTARDYPVLLGLFLIMSMLVIATNLLTDFLHRIIDPRVKGR
ncbi:MULTISPECIES: ABC transporter permease [Brucella/Ochrobactrum group]|uniref:ABC transporter permease n=1 Tax=Ochrobactrum teleogrylli TaxID=2479765 RepID=A0ABD5K6L1_9HYPH|nr:MULTISPECIES: ABC transporter permease [Brucella/Ochrobactrum group]MBA8845866.1 peptide/nickel transport system permease protein [Ochrobactrum sp. RH1CCR137]MBA8857588.1 peptide/nickel transport system permease protein [Ochrobactrum sp. RH1CCR134]UXO86196.1 ABC transporter permease [Brucella intermedia]